MALLDLPGEMIAAIMNKLNFRDCIRFLDASKELKKRMRREKISHPFVLIQFHKSAALSVFDPVSRTWHGTYNLNESGSNMVASSGDLLCLKNSVSNQVLVLNTRTKDERLLPPAPEFTVAQLIDLAGGKFKVFCIASDPLQVWVYDSSVRRWKGNSAVYNSSWKPTSMATWNDKIWIMLENNSLVVYDINRDRIVENALSTFLSRLQRFLFVVCCDNRLLLVSSKALHVVIYEIRNDVARKLSSIRIPPMHIRGVCSDGVGRIWIVGGILKRFVEFNLLRNRWTWIDLPETESNLWLPLPPCYANLEMLNVKGTL